ncbi:MAG TPA: BON domain-containing protein [Candidatus Binatia bacterium]|nr:BON domain-containing protein [Candidatus Binatia bacterium]
MKSSTLAIAVMLIVGSALAAAQSASSSSGTQAGLNASSGKDQGAPAYGNNTYSSGAHAVSTNSGTQQATTPQVAGSQQTVPAQPNPPSAPGNTASGPNNPGDPDSAALQSRIADALRNEPALGASHVSVKVSETSIELSGTADTGKNKQTAERIAGSFDGNRQLKDSIVVIGQGHSGATTGQPAMNRSGDGANPAPAAAANHLNSTPPQQR